MVRTLLETSRSSRQERVPRPSGREESWLWSRRRVWRLTSAHTSGTRDGSRLWLCGVGGGGLHGAGQHVRCERTLSG